MNCKAYSNMDYTQNNSIPALRLMKKTLTEFQCNLNLLIRIAIEKTGLNLLSIEVDILQ